MNKKIPVGLSNRHVHLSQSDLEKLFGKDYKLSKMKNLIQPNQFASNEKIDIIGPKNIIENVRILGPVREKTQVEISIMDSFILGVNPHIRDSGELENTSGCKLKGPNGEIFIEKGVIVAARHIHMHSQDAELLDIRDKEYVSVKTAGVRSLVFNNVLVRVGENYAMEFHIDLDEGNSSALKTGDFVELVRTSI